MKARAIIGIIFVVASLLKLAAMWNILQISWLNRVSKEPGAQYFAIFILIYVGVCLIYDGFKAKK
jgi:hypothetical protein